MRKSRFTDEQIISILKQSEAGLSTNEIIRQHGISRGAFYAWRKKFGGMEVEDAKRLKQLKHCYSSSCPVWEGDAIVGWQQVRQLAQLGRETAQESQPTFTW